MKERVRAEPIWQEVRVGWLMTSLRVLSFGISIDGLSAGPNQSLDDPIGIGGMAMIDWARATRTFREMHGVTGGDATGIDEEFVARGFRNIGAWIMGRNMFGPERGPWPNLDWKGWWGQTPPFHTDVFVLTHYARPALQMDGGSTCYFVTDGVKSALEQATKSARGKDVRLGGGVSLVRQYLKAGLVDEMHLAIVPKILGNDESLLSGIDLLSMGYRCMEYVPSPNVVHVVLEKEKR